MAQHKATLRTSLRSALSHKKLADDFLSDLVSIQTRMNDMAAQLETDGTIISAGFSTAYPSTSTLSVDAPGTDAQHKASYRTSMRSALRNKGLADDLLDSLEEIDTAMDTAAIQLTADAGVAPAPGYANYKATVDDPLESAGDAPYKTSRRRTLEIALCHSTLSDNIVDAMSAIQTSWNAIMDLLEAGDGTGSGALVVPVLNPDAP